jgi:hypothetical protein
MVLDPGAHADGKVSGVTSALPSNTAARIERRAAVAESLSEIVRVMERLDVAFETASVAGPVDPGGDLRAAARAVLPVAAKIPGFDVTVAAGRHGGWAVRVRNRPDGVTAALSAPGAAGQPAESGPAGSTVVTQLAELLRGSDGGVR